MTIEGNIKEKYETQSIKDTFKKREFVLEYAENPQYPEFLKFELIQGNCEQLDTVELGDTVTINFNLKGRKWTDPKGEVKYFNTLQAWRIEKKAGINTLPPPIQEPNWAEEDFSLNEDFSQDDDFPF